MEGRIGHAKSRDFYALLQRLADNDGWIALASQDYQAICRQLACREKDIEACLTDLLGRRVLEARWIEPSGENPFGRIRYRIPEAYRTAVSAPIVETTGRLPISNDDRALVWDRSGGRCWYCGKLTNPFRDFHVDHVVPVVDGGTNDLTNLVPSCADCNARKGSLNFEAFRARQELATGSRYYRFFCERFGLSDA